MASEQINALSCGALRGRQLCFWSTKLLLVVRLIHLCLRIESRHMMATKCRRKSRTPVETIDPVILASVAICEFVRLFLLLLCCKPVLSVTVSTVIELFFVSKSGEMSCEPLDQPCPTPQCNHPARRKGECCPTCDGWFSFCYLRQLKTSVLLL